MDMYPKYKSPLGYSTGDNNIDAYGVDHSGFSNRDEIEYQIAREARENQIIQNYNNQGITENYPQYTTNFWGSSPENNYGFGASKIHDNIENMQNQTNFGNNTQWGMNNEQSQVYNPLGNSNSTLNSGLNNSSLLSPNNMQGLNLDASAALYPQQNSFSTYSQPYQLAQNSLSNTGSDVGNIEDREKLEDNKPNNINSGYGQSNTQPKGYNIFGTSSQNATETLHKALGDEPVRNVIGKTTLNRLENIKRELQQDALDVAYGASRTINGITAGGLDYLGDKLGFDSRMNSYLDSLSESERVQRESLVDALEFGGAALPVGTFINAGVRVLRIPYNAWQIGRAYDKLRKDPFIGKMKDHNGENVLLQRGEVIRGQDGSIKVSGNDLLRETGTKRNFGLNKVIYKHDITKEQATKIPRYIRGNPVETNQYGQSVYEIKRPDGNFRIVTSSKDADKILSSMYKIER